MGSPHRRGEPREPPRRGLALNHRHLTSGSGRSGTWLLPLAGAADSESGGRALPELVFLLLALAVGIWARTRDPATEPPPRGNRRVRCNPNGPRGPGLADYRTSRGSVASLI